MDVSIFTAFIAGVFSFLSPCVLPLVPGYISMLSGIGVEQLKEGKAPRGGLLVSAVAFVSWFLGRCSSRSALLPAQSAGSYCVTAPPSRPSPAP